MEQVCVRWMALTEESCLTPQTLLFHKSRILGYGGRTTNPFVSMSQRTIASGEGIEEIILYPCGSGNKLSWAQDPTPIPCRRLLLLARGRNFPPKWTTVLLLGDRRIGTLRKSFQCQSETPNVQLMLDKHSRKSYTPTTSPVLVSKQCLSTNEGQDKSMERCLYYGKDGKEWLKTYRRNRDTENPLAPHSPLKPRATAARY